MARPSEYTEIYELSDPLTGHVKYVGKAVNSAKRLQSHLSDAKHRKTPVYEWIRSLIDCGARPKMRVVACTIGDWAGVERKIIAQYKDDRVNILNLAPGGNEPHCSAEVRAKNGRANAALVHNDPTRRKMWKLKQRAGLFMRCPYISVEAKQKIAAAFMLNPEFWGGWVPKCPQ